MSLRRAAVWSLFDQVLLSGVHFGIGLAVLRLSTKEDYGAYVISWSVLLLLAGLQNAFINTQMTLQAAGLPLAQRRPIHTVFLAGQLLLYSPLAVAVLIGAALLALARPELQKLSATAVVVVLAFAGVGLREFVRSSLLLALDTRRVFLIDAVYAATLVALVAAGALFLPRSYLGISAVLSLGCASFAAALTAISALLQPGLSWRSGLGRSGLDTLRGNSKNSLWAAGGVAVTHFQSQAYVYVLGIFSGVATTAEANAARLLLMPLSLAITSMQRVLYPRWITLARAGDHTALASMSRKVLAAVTAGIVIYTVLLAFSSHWLIDELLGPEYRASGSYLLIFAALVWAEAARTILSSQLQAYARFREITIANAITVVPVLLAAAALMKLLGPHTVAWAQVAGDLGLTLLLWRIWKTMRRPAV